MLKKRKIDIFSSKWIPKIQVTEYKVIGVPQFSLACYMFACMKSEYTRVTSNSHGRMIRGMGSNIRPPCVIELHAQVFKQNASEIKI
jgi:hypothetical protein